LTFRVTRNAITPRCPIFQRNQALSGKKVNPGEDPEDHDREEVDPPPQSVNIHLDAPLIWTPFGPEQSASAGE